MIKGTFTASTVNGTDTVISGLSNPKAIMLFTTKQTSAAASDANGEWYFGWATYRGSAVQQCYGGRFDLDAAATSDTAKGLNTTACLKGYSAANPTVEFEFRLVSMDATSITIDTFDAPAAAILVHYVVWDDSDGITDAYCGSFAAGVAVATTDVALPSGFGVPDFIMSSTNSTTTLGDSTNTRISLGFDNGTGHAHLGVWGPTDASATMLCSSFLTADGFASFASISGFDGQGTFDKVNSPTDSFRCAWSNQFAAAHQFCYLALKGVTTSIGTMSAPTAGSPPVNVDYNAGFAPGGALFLTDGLVSHPTTIDQASADLLYCMVGATDGTNQGLSANTQDDNNADSMAGKIDSTTKAFARYHAPTPTAAPVLDSEADGSFTGNNVRLAFNDIDSVATAIAVCAFQAVAAPTVSVQVVRSRYLP